MILLLKQPPNNSLLVLGQVQGYWTVARTTGLVPSSDSGLIRVYLFLLIWIMFPPPRPKKWCPTVHECIKGRVVLVSW